MQKANTKKSYKIEDVWAAGYIESKCKLISESPEQDINKCLDMLISVLGIKANKCLNIGRGGSHIYISDVWNKRVAIIFFNN